MHQTMTTSKPPPRFYVLEFNALGVRDSVDGNNIHLGSKVEAVEVCTMLNVIHEAAMTQKHTITVQAQRILELTGGMHTSREVYLRQERRIVDAEARLSEIRSIASSYTFKITELVTRLRAAEAKALTAIAKNLREDNDTDNYEVGVHF